MMIAIEIATDHIRLDQLLKLADLVAGGGEAKALIQAGEVRHNGEVELRRGRKIRPGDRVELFDQTVEVARAT